jgi:hypothetical protein
MGAGLVPQVHALADPNAPNIVGALAADGADAARRGGSFIDVASAKAGTVDFLL